MRALRFTRFLAVAACVAAVAAGAWVHAQQPQFEPKVGQAGKDVVWVPTSQTLVNKMLDMAGLTPADFLMDLGSGDGRTVITAAKRGARATGVEFNPNMVELSRRNATKEGVSDRATFINGDLFEADLSKATVITLFLLPDINLRLRPKLLDLKPGTRVVSNSFTMEDWEADETATVDEDCTSWCTALLWIVPAKVEGTWQMPNGQIDFTQSFQMLGGKLAQSGGSSGAITDGRLRGEEIKFTVNGAQYTGRVSGNTMSGTVMATGKTTKWSATRK